MRPWASSKLYKSLFWLSDSNSTGSIYPRRVSTRFCFCFFVFFGKKKEEYLYINGVRVPGPIPASRSRCAPQGETGPQCTTLQSHRSAPQRVGPSVHHISVPPVHHMSDPPSMITNMRELSAREARARFLYIYIYICIDIYIYIYTFRALIPEAWEAGRLAGWRLRYLATHSEPLYIALEPRFLRPGRLGWLGGWEAGWLGC